MNNELVLDAGTCHQVALGSNAQWRIAIERLEQLGAKVSEGHEAANVAGAHVVVYSSAVSRDNIEVQVAQQRGIPVIRCQALHLPASGSAGARPAWPNC